jgi:hypothetical protein
MIAVAGASCGQGSGEAETGQDAGAEHGHGADAGPGQGDHPVIDSAYSLDDITAAHRSLETSGGFGKRVIQVA